jgi:hypothetical protein
MYIAATLFMSYGGFSALLVEDDLGCTSMHNFCNRDSKSQQLKHSIQQALKNKLCTVLMAQILEYKNFLYQFGSNDVTTLQPLHDILS